MQKGAGIKISHEERGKPDFPVFLWAHGWGQDRRAFEALAASLEQAGRHILIDFPGFGDSPEPPDTWSTAEYADALAAFIKEKNAAPVIWVGHSFGCRVGLQIAARHPDLISGLFLIAAAGLKRKRPLHVKFYLKMRVALYKLLKKLVPLGLPEDWLKTKFGSRDYRSASGIMRGVFIKTVNEDLSEVAAGVTCPALLVYGENDSETPPEIGERLAKIIPDAQLFHLAGQDHYSVLAEGRHPVAAALKQFKERLEEP